MKQKNRIVTIAKMFLLLLSLVLPWTVQKQVLAETSAGSITVNLKELETPKSDVAFKVYKVGEWNGAEGQWTLVENLSDTGIIFADLVYASEWDAAAMKLSKQDTLETLSEISGMTDENGTLVFSNLELGIYLVVQNGESEYGIVSPFLAALPYSEEGTLKTELTIEPKAELPLEEGNGRIEVTKRVGKIDPELMEIVDIILREEVSYYIGIFKDEKGQIPYGTDYIREIPMQGISKGTASFENLPSGTYYIFETDAEGNAIQLNERQEDEEENIWICRLDEGTETQEISLDGKAETPAGTVGFYNQYYELNNHYYYTGIINISKEVKKGSEEITVPESFYVGVFTDKAGTELYTVEELEQNGIIVIEVPLGGEDKTEDITYYVYETDEEGNLIDKENFDYIVSGEGKVELRNGHWEATISLVNTLKEAEPTVTPTVTATPTITAVPTVTETPEKTNTVQTGDDTPVMGYLLMAMAALLVGILGIVIWRGKKKHE